MLWTNGCQITWNSSAQDAKYSNISYNQMPVQMRREALPHHLYHFSEALSSQTMLAYSILFLLTNLYMPVIDDHIVI